MITTCLNLYETINVASLVQLCLPLPDIPTNKQLPLACFITLHILQMCLVASVKNTKFILSLESALYSFKNYEHLFLIRSILSGIYYMNSALVKLQNTIPISLNICLFSSLPIFNSFFNAFCNNSS